MSTELAKADAPSIDPAIVEKVLLEGDLRRLSAAQKVSYYNQVCASVGLNPLTQPFAYIVLSGREVLYARREATEQLRRIHQVSITIPARELVEDVYVVTAHATQPNGRTDESIGAVAIAGLKGEARANAMMKAETKAKRRVTLAICGLGLLDETEVESINAEYTVEKAPAPEPPPVEPPVQNDQAPPADMPEGAVTIRRVHEEPTRNPKVKKYFLLTSAGEEVQTINHKLAHLAEAVRDENAPVWLTSEATRFGNELKAIKRVTEASPKLPMVSADDIPF